MAVVRVTLIVLWAIMAGFVDCAVAQNVGTKAALNTPSLQLFQGDGTNFVLVDDLYYEIKRTGRIIRVPSGFVTDFASVPWYARSAISVLGRHSIPAIVHDYLYWEQRCSREQADAILFDAMDEYKSSPWQQWLVYYSVHWRAGGAWEENKEDRAKGYVRVLTGRYKVPPLNMDWPSYREDLRKAGVAEPSVAGGVPGYCFLEKAN
ncbi:MAG: DUF1353 domain-containing protein [Deltaproteobacteria bacterium]